MTPGKHGYVPEYACNAEYNYNPSFPAAVIVATGFGFLLVAHIWQAIHYKKFKLCWPLLVGVSWEFASFLTRTLGSLNQQSGTLATISQILVLVAPIWVNAFVYMVMGRLVYMFVDSKKIWGVKSVSLTKYFVWLDVASFLMQGESPQNIAPTAGQEQTGLTPPQLAAD